MSLLVVFSGSAIRHLTLTCDTQTYAVSGQATGLKHDARALAQTQTYTVAGQATGLKHGAYIYAQPQAYTLTGIDVTLTYTAGSTLEATTQTYTLAGQTVGLALYDSTYRDITGESTGAYTLPIDPGAYSLTGRSATLRTARMLSATQQTYTLTGTATALRSTRRLPTVSQTYTITGFQTTFKRGRTLAAAIQTYTLTGYTTGLTRTRRLIAQTGAFSLTGQAIGLKRSLKLTVTKGTFTLTGTSTGVYAGRKVLATSRAYLLTGYPLTVAGRQYQLYAQTAPYILTGYDARLRPSKYCITADQADLLWQICQLHGLIGPLVVGPTARSSDNIIQEVVQNGGTVTISTLTRDGYITRDAGTLIEELAALHGITADLIVTPTSRIAGGISQTMETVGGVTTVTRL